MQCLSTLWNEGQTCKHLREILRASRRRMTLRNRHFSRQLTAGDVQISTLKDSDSERKFRKGPDQTTLCTIIAEASSFLWFYAIYIAGFQVFFYFPLDTVFSDIFLQWVSITFIDQGIKGPPIELPKRKKETYYVHFESTFTELSADRTGWLGFSCSMWQLSTGIQSLCSGVARPGYSPAPPLAICLKLGKMTYPLLVHLQDGDKSSHSKDGSKD